MVRQWDRMLLGHHIGVCQGPSFSEKTLETLIQAHRKYRNVPFGSRVILHRTTNLCHTPTSEAASNPSAIDGIRAIINSLIHFETSFCVTTSSQKNQTTFQDLSAMALTGRRPFNFYTGKTNGSYGKQAMSRELRLCI